MPQVKVTRTLEKDLLAALLALRAESVICKTHHGSELWKAQRQADRVIRRATAANAIAKAEGSTT